MKATCTRCGKPRDRNASRCVACSTVIRTLWRINNKERDAKNRKDWINKNREKSREYARNNYLRHKNRFKKAAIEWAKKNPKKRSAIMVFQNAKRRSRILANGGAGFSKSHWDELLKRSGGVCCYCRKEKANSIDHFNPISLGGQHDYRNLVPSCVLCNSIKSDNEPVTWITKTHGHQALEYVKQILIK